MSNIYDGANMKWVTYHARWSSDINLGFHPGIVSKRLILEKRKVDT